MAASAAPMEAEFTTKMLWKIPYICKQSQDSV